MEKSYRDQHPNGGMMPNDHEHAGDQAMGSTPTPEDPKERWRRHFRHTMSIKQEEHVVQRFFANSKIFLADAWLDILCVVITLGVVGAVWVAPHTHNRLFPVTFFTSGDIVFPEFAYPYVEPIFSPAGAGFVAGLVPLGIILIAQIWERSFFDFAHGVLGLAYSMATGTLFQVVLKKTIGGLRPHFLSVCEPVIPENYESVGVGFQNIMFTVDQVCTGDPGKIGNAITSFPSGHANIAFAGLGYLAIYLFAHLRILSFRRRASFWKMGFVLLPVLLATYLTSTLVLGYHHHGYDVIFGSLIGITMSFFSYRMVYCSIINHRWNTVPRRRFENEQREQRRAFAGSDEEARMGSGNGASPKRFSSGTTAAGEDRPGRI